MLLPPYRTFHEPSPPKPHAGDKDCALCALRAALRSVRVRTLLVTGAVAASVFLNVGVVFAAAYSARLATQTLALTDAVATVVADHDAKIREASKRRSAAPPPPAPPPPAPPPPAPPPPEPSSCVALGVAKLGPQEFAIDRSVIERVLEKIAENVHCNRGFRDEELSGIRLTRIARVSELSSLGFEDGDVVWTINGFDMTNPEKALEAYAKLRSADELDVMLSRKGVLRLQRYHVRGGAQ